MSEASHRRVTRAELIVILGMLFVVVGLALPWIQWAREQAHRSQCRDNLKNIVLALHNFNDRHNRLPPAVGWLPAKPPGDSERAIGAVYGNLFFHLLPDLHEESVQQAAAQREGDELKYVPWQNEIFRRPVRTYLCPSNPSADGQGMTDVGWAASGYAFNAQVFAKTDESRRVIDWDGTTHFSKSFHRGTWLTVLVTEKYPRCAEFGNLWAAWEPDLWLPAFGIWGREQGAMYQVRPRPYLSDACDPTRPSSAHPTGINVGMADGRVWTPRPDPKPGGWDEWWRMCLLDEYKLPQVDRDAGWNVFGP